MRQMKLNEEKRFESLKILFFGESERLIASATGDRAKNLKKLEMVRRNISLVLKLIPTAVS